MVDPKQIQAQCDAIILLLKEERERQRLAMLTVAQRAGLSQQMVSYVERGIRRPTLDTVLRMAAALDMDLPCLFRNGSTAAAKRP